MTSSGLQRYPWDRVKHTLENAGWYDAQETGRQTDANGYFDINIPLKMLLGFFEDYNKIVVNAKHELILRRANTDNNAIIQTQAEDGIRDSP